MQASVAPLVIHLGILFICSVLGRLVTSSLRGALVGGSAGLVASLVVTRVIEKRIAARARHELQHPDPLDVADPEDTEFLGVYVPHWELARFIVVGRTGTVEQWALYFPEGELDRLNLDLGGRHRHGKSYRMRVRGRRGPRGEFGHKGICSRELFVATVLTCEETDASAPSTASA